MTFRTLRAANASLYLAATLLVWLSAIYVLCCREELWQQLTAIAAMLIALLWGSYYVRLRYTIDAQGITHRSLWGIKKLSWNGAELELREQQSQEIRALTLRISNAGVVITLSSDELPLEQVEELIAELRCAGLL